MAWPHALRLCPQGRVSALRCGYDRARRAKYRPGPTRFIVNVAHKTLLKKHAKTSVRLGAWRGSTHPTRLRPKADPGHFQEIGTFPLWDPFSASIV